jgi:SAM-dependent methyltransferase
MLEQSKSARRRWFDGAFHSRYFVGDGIDIGGAPDPLAQYCGLFPAMRSVRTWDMDDGDGQLMAGVADNSFDFVHSSHCLEHMRNVEEALANWLRILKPGGHLVITVPDEDLYEHGQWPSRFNRDHKWSFTVAKPISSMPRSINVVELVERFAHVAECERLQLLRDFFREGLEKPRDQTLTPVAECAIEFVLRKRPQPLATAQAMLNRQLDRLRTTRLTQSAGKGEPHAVVVPVATYAPWHADSRFGAALQKCGPHLASDPYRAYELWTLIGQLGHVPGDILDVGARRGGSAALIGQAMTAHGIGADLVVAERWATAEPAAAGGAETTATEAKVRALLAACGVERTTLLAGAFPLPAAGPVQNRRFRFARVCAASERDAHDAFEWIWPRLASGAAVVFDDYGAIQTDGVRRFVDTLRGRSGLLVVHNLNGHAVVSKSGA